MMQFRIITEAEADALLTADRPSAGRRSSQPAEPATALIYRSRRKRDDLWDFYIAALSAYLIVAAQKGD